MTFLQALNQSISILLTFVLSAVFIIVLVFSGWIVFAESLFKKILACLFLIFWVALGIYSYNNSVILQRL